MRDSWQDALKLVVIDEVHNIMSSRGGVISTILGMCGTYEIPVLILTGTPHRLMIESLQGLYQGRMQIFTNDRASRCQQIPIRIDDDETFHATIYAAYLNSISVGSGGHACLVFGYATKDVYRVFQAVVAKFREWASPPGLDVAWRERVLGALCALENNERTPIPACIDVSWSGQRPPGSIMLTSQLLADERRTAWMALNAGIAYYWRGVGEQYSRVIMQRLAKGQIHLLISTSKLSAGVNLPGIRHVCIHSASQNQAELAQMIGRCGRKGMGFCFIRGRDPPTAEQIMASIPPPATGLLRDLTFWWLIKKAAAQMLSPARNITRWQLSVEQWLDFLRHMPLPTFSNDVKEREFSQHIEFLVENIRICSIKQGVIVTSITDELLRISEIDPQMLTFSLHLVENLREIRAPDDIPVVLPWVVALLYWVSKIDQLPTIIWTGNRRELPALLGRPFATSTVPTRLETLDSQIRILIYSTSSLGTPFVQLRPAKFAKLSALVILTTYALIGIDVGWASHLPRRDLLDVLVELPVYASALYHLISYKEEYTGVWAPRFDVQAWVVRCAADMAASAIHPERHPDYIIESATPLIALAIQKFRAQNDPRSVVEVLATQHLIPKGWLRWCSNEMNLRCLFPESWRGSLGALRPQGAGELRALPLDLLSD
jgi:hypothetical protein